MNGDILTLNAGSSSIKFAVFGEGSESPKARISGKIAGIGRNPKFSAKREDSTPLSNVKMRALTPEMDHEALVAKLLDWLSVECSAHPLRAVGHRVVHGGTDFHAPLRVTEDVLTRLDTLVPLAPLHQPHNLAAIRAVATWQPDLAQIACFDTAFHRTQPRLATLFALPRALTDEGVLRYGFHGLSYDYIASILPEHLGAQAQGRVIVAHLGNGSSMCALKDRQSVATSMGFTALDGLMMGQRCGDLDPGVLLYLMQSKGMSAPDIETLLYKQSGLLGVSGISNSMEVLEASPEPQAAEAIALYAYQAARTLAGLVASIGGLDALVFTGGIGENSAQTRKAICAQLTWLGVALDDTANAHSQTKISTSSSRVEVLVLPTNEEQVIANACATLLASGVDNTPRAATERRTV